MNANKQGREQTISAPYWREVNCEGMYKQVIGCRKCPRLVDFRENVKITPRFDGEKFWRKPVPGYGDTKGHLMIVGLAPAASGGNRTGRIFTGDKSAEYLVSALYEAGLCSQATSTSRNDGLRYIDSYITAAVKCAPPDNKPTREEQLNCLVYLDAEFLCNDDLNCILALGHFAFRSILDRFKFAGFETKGMKFKNGRYCEIPGIRIYTSYHPTPRNVNTGRLKRMEFVGMLKEIRKYMGQ